MCNAVSIGRKVAPRIAEGQAYAPGVRTRIVDVNFVGGIGRYSAATDHIHPAVEVKPSRFPSGSWYRRNRANGVSYWIEAE